MIYIDEKTGRMVNIYAPFKGRSQLDSEEIRAAVGVVEIERDTPPEGYIDHPDWYDVREDWDATQRPYIIYTKRSDEMIAATENGKIKAQISALEDQQGRAIREAVLTGDKTRLAALDQQITELRANLVVLP